MSEFDDNAGRFGGPFRPRPDDAGSVSDSLLAKLSTLFGADPDVIKPKVERWLKIADAAEAGVKVFVERLK